MMKKLFCILFINFCLIYFYPVDAAPKVSNRSSKIFYPVSLLTLIVNPYKYDGKGVRLQGVFRFYFSDSAVFASQEWFKHDITRNAVLIKLDVKPSDINRYINWSGKYVEVQGIFDSNSHGDLSAYAGTIKDISFIHLISD